MRKRHRAASRRGLPRTGPPLGSHSGRILLLEDEPAVREVLGELLARSGFIVIAGGSLADGMAVLESLGWKRVDLVITDTHLGREGHVWNGVEFHARWRERHPVPPFIFLDGWGGAAKASLPSAESCQVHCLAKPFGYPALLGLIRAILGPSG